MGVIDISAQEAKAIIDKQGGVLIDVREPAEHENSHIPSSALHPVNSIRAKDIGDCEHPLVIYCQRGIRGQTAGKKLLSENPTLQIYNIAGGIEAWQKAGYQTQQSQSSGVSLAAQVTLTLGIATLIFIALSIVATPLFWWASWLTGLLLVIESTTRFFGLARFFALLPWNQT
ncbi:rhodanese-like domain-containing protein [Glaciecola sp. XM2]|jgi:rhodanese-related sulfurtransferase|uniref:rhodanese-like domain-containing protein n=1 Tax=Glaciecola sp. XM2 TaxID=1914931 RepID=UPI001BDE929E|nr:rhodanese-like domain-containing protein [Glaciecola sp. XM2]MBT1451185.1 rhodanese-like domain-containing protein [Glaciecola sp. XM2]